ncbi:13505_t:CDS:2, partial [Acaulospora morrowiae]
TYKILVAAEESNISFNAIQYAFDLCSRLSASYTLSIIYVVALNPETNVPFIHSLDRASNLNILLEAKETVAKIKEHLKKFESIHPNVKYQFIEHEDHGLVGEILKGYIEKKQPDLNLLIVGSRNLDGLQKVCALFPRASSVLSLVLSSTSDYLVKNIRCPVTIVKP